MNLLFSGDWMGPLYFVHAALSGHISSAKYGIYCKLVSSKRRPFHTAFHSSSALARDS